MLRPAGMLRSPPAGEAGLDRLHLVPLLVRHDAKSGNFGDRPGLGLVQPGNALSGVGILVHPQAVVDQEPDVRFVVENAIPPGGVPVDRRRVPRLALRRGNAAAVQILRDRPGAEPQGDLVVYFPDDSGLRLVHAPLAANGLSLFIEFPHHVIAIAQAGGDAARLRPPLLPATHLGGEIPQEQGVHRALHADVQFGNEPFLHRVDDNSVMLEAFEDRRDVLLVARQAVQPLGDHGVEEAGLRILEQPLRLRARPQVGAGDRVVGVDVHDRSAVPLGMLPADTDLILDRPLMLIVGRIACVDRGFHAGLVL